MRANIPSGESCAAAGAVSALLIAHARAAAHQEPSVAGCMQNASVPVVLPSLPRLPASVTLVIGVLSFNFTGRSNRRAWIRRLSEPSTLARLFFVLPLDQPDVDSGWEDVISFDIPRVDRGVLGKYLLQNRWFLYGSLLPKHVTWVARMDDDAAVNAAVIASRLQLIPSEQLVVYGPHRNWYMWHPTSMQAVCWDYNPNLWWRMVRASSMSSPPPAPPPPPGRRRRVRSAAPPSQSECLRDGLVGPYPFAAGPFMAYSRSVAKLIAGMLDADEAYVLGPRRQQRLVNIKTGYVAAPTHRSHPSRRILMEEIYYAYMLFRELHNASNGPILVDEPMHEIFSRSQIYPNEPRGGFRVGHFEHIYHKLRYASHFETLFNTSYLSGSRQDRSAPLTLVCDRLGSRWIPAIKRAMQERYGLHGWKRCHFSDHAQFGSRRTKTDWAASRLSAAASTRT